MSIEGFLAEGQGKTDTIVKVLTVLIATHPEKDKVMRTLDALLKPASESETDNANVKSYKRGVRKTVERLIRDVKKSTTRVEQIHDLNARPTDL